MNSDSFNYALSVVPFLPYSKAAGKYLVSQTVSLSLGVIAFVTSHIMKGDAEMNKPEWFDYLVAHPVTVPLWVWALLYSYPTLFKEGWLATGFFILYLCFWLRLYRDSLVRILEYQSAEEGKEVLPCPELAKT